VQSRRGDVAAEVADGRPIWIGFELAQPREQLRDDLAAHVLRVLRAVSKTTQLAPDDFLNDGVSVSRDELPQHATRIRLVRRPQERQQQRVRLSCRFVRTHQQIPSESQAHLKTSPEVADFLLTKTIELELVVELGRL
jgi:hypothetical protein